MADIDDEIRALHGRLKLTILFVTHHPEDAARLAEEVIFLEDGRTVEQGTAAHFFSPGAPAAFRRYLGATG